MKKIVFEPRIVLNERKVLHFDYVLYFWTLYTFQASNFPQIDAAKRDKNSRVTLQPLHFLHRTFQGNFWECRRTLFSFRQF